MAVRGAFQRHGFVFCFFTPAERGSEDVLPKELDEGRVVLWCEVQSGSLYLRTARSRDVGGAARWYKWQCDSSAIVARVR